MEGASLTPGDEKVEPESTGWVGVGNLPTKGKEGVEVRGGIKIKNKYVIKKENKKEGEGKKGRQEGRMDLYLLEVYSFGFCLKCMALVKLDLSADTQVDANLHGGKRHLAETAILLASGWL